MNWFKRKFCSIPTIIWKGCEYTQLNLLSELITDYERAEKDIKDIFRRLSLLEVPRDIPDDYEVYIDDSPAGKERRAIGRILIDKIPEVYGATGKKKTTPKPKRQKSAAPKDAKPGDRYTVMLPGKFMPNPDDDVPTKTVTKTVGRPRKSGKGNK